jgi:hypothetical protein
MHEFLTGFIRGLRPFLAALPLLWKGAMILTAGSLAGALIDLLGANALGAALVVMAAIAGAGCFVLAWIRVFQASASGGGS